MVRTLLQAKLESAIGGPLSRELYKLRRFDNSCSCYFPIPEKKVGVLCVDRQCLHLSLTQIFGSYLDMGPNSTVFLSALSGDYSRLNSAKYAMLYAAYEMPL